MYIHEEIGGVNDKKNAYKVYSENEKYYTVHGCTFKVLEKENRKRNSSI